MDKNGYVPFVGISTAQKTITTRLLKMMDIEQITIKDPSSIVEQ